MQGLISGSLDLDKIEYLKRDALMCGVPYGEINVDRLTHSMTIVPDPDSGAPTLGVVEKGLAAIESLLFAKYQMYRNVYWHHAVRSATAMYKRLVSDALATGVLRADTIVQFTDEGLLDHLRRHAPSALLDALRYRHLYKRAFEIPAAALPDGVGEWIATDGRARRPSRTGWPRAWGSPRASSCSITRPRRRCWVWTSPFSADPARSNASRPRDWMDRSTCPLSPPRCTSPRAGSASSWRDGRRYPRMMVMAGACGSDDSVTSPMRVVRAGRGDACVARRCVPEGRVRAHP